MEQIRGNGAGLDGEYGEVYGDAVLSVMANSEDFAARVNLNVGHYAGD